MSQRLSPAGRRPSIFKAIASVFGEGFSEGFFPNGIPTPTPIEAIAWVRQNEQDLINAAGFATFVNRLPEALNKVLHMKVTRRQFIQGAGLAAAAVALSACAPDAEEQTSTAQPIIPPTRTQTAEAIQQATALPTETLVPAPENLEQPIVDFVPSIIKGLALGQIKTKDVIGNETVLTAGTVDKYITPINTLYKVESPGTTFAFGVDQEYLKGYFDAQVTDKGIVGNMNGKAGGGAEVILKNGVWEEVETGKVFIPFNLAAEGYPVIDLNKKIRHVDKDGNDIVGSIPQEMFKTPQEIANQVGYIKPMDNVTHVEMTGAGTISFIELVPNPKKPENQLQIINETDFILPPEDLSKNEIAKKAIEQFANALTNAGIAKTPEELFAQGFTTMRVEGLDPTDPTKTKKKNYDIMTVRIDDSEIGGDYPLMIRNEEAMWEPTTFKNLANARGILIGTNFGTPYFDSSTVYRLKELVKNNYNMAVIDTIAMQQSEVEKGKFTFSKADQALSEAISSNMYTEGDDLLFGSSNQKWTYMKGFKEQGASSKEELKAAMLNHIETVVGKYKGQMKQWSVVCEPGHSPGDDVYMDIIGEEYIDLAFAKVKEIDPSSRTVLTSTRADTRSGKNYIKTLERVKRLNAKGLIDAVAIELHIDGSESPSKEELISTFQSYDGVETIASSIDIDMSKVSGSPDEILRKQARIGKMLYEVMIESGVSNTMTFWEGFGDDYNWLVRNNKIKNANATPFDSKLNPKLLYFSVLQGIFEDLE